MTKDDAKPNLQWHPAFVQAIQAELFDYRDVLEFRQEYLLNAAPLQIDLLIIKKPRELVIDKNIARIFRTDNVVEYKGPGDYLSIEDFWKVCAYANLYAAITDGVDLSDVTLTFVGSKYPRELLKYLTKTRGYMVEKTSPGIHMVKGDYLPIQIIESKKLPKEENLWLESLRNDLKTGDAGIILNKERRKKEAPLDAYMDILLRANPRAFLEVQEMARRETFEEVFTKAGIIPEWLERGRVQGLKQGLAQGREETARNALAKGLTPEFVHDITGLDMATIQGLNS